MDTRIYVVKSPGERGRLVIASSQAQAIGHVVKDLKYEATPAKPKEIAEMMSDGAQVETAKAEKSED